MSGSSIARKIAAALRGVARRLDPPAPRPEVEARLAAIMAIPRSVNRFTARRAFSNRMAGDRFAPVDPLVVRIASEIEAREPGLYTGNDDMVAAIGRYRAGGGL